MIALYASKPVYVDHLAPIARALGDDAVLLVLEAKPRDRGEVVPSLLARAEALGVPHVATGVPRGPGGPVVVASAKDATWVHTGRPLALVEHGAGQSYLDFDRPGYAGAPGWGRCSLFLVPGPHAAEGWRAAYPGARVLEVGPLVLDRWLAPAAGAEVRVLNGCGEQVRVLRPEVGWARGDPPTVAFTFHWPCRVSPEAGSAFGDWRFPLARLGYSHGARWRLLGHWHPRWGDTLARFYPGAGFEPVADYNEVLERADLLVADNTSAMYEFAATGRPVLALNASGWRRGVEHGLRFWSHVPGLQAWPGVELGDAIVAALEDPANAQTLRRAAVARAYGGWLDGGAAERAAAEIRRWAG